MKSSQMKSGKAPTSKGKTNTANDAATDDQNSTQEDATINLGQLESLFSQFNDEKTKLEICKYLNNVEGLITEET